MASNALNLISEDVFAEKMDTLNVFLAELAKNTGGVEVDSFKTLQLIVRRGLASKVLSIGDQIISEKASAVNATVGNSQGEAGITAASVVKDTFLHAIGISHGGDYEFYWDGAAWHYNDEPVELTTYGISVTGTPALGDEIVVHETADKLVWDVIGIDADTPSDSQFTHSLTLGLHDVFTSLQFDAREAVYASEEGLAAGTYNITISAQPWFAGDVGKTVQFTLTSALPAKGQIVLDNAYNATMVGSTLKTYANGGSTSPIETATISEGSGGTSLGSVGNAISGGLNSIQRALLGYNNNHQSALRQYLNSNAAAGYVWAQQNAWDRTPSWNASTSGFLNGMDEEFLAVIGKVRKVTALNTVTDGGGSETTDEKFFLLSRSEVYGGDESSIHEGNAYPYYSNYSDLNAAGTGADANRIKYINGSAQYWWLRSPSAGSASTVRTVNTDGHVYSYYAYEPYGVAPACCII